MSNKILSLKHHYFESDPGAKLRLQLASLACLELGMGAAPLHVDDEPVDASRNINLVEIGGKSCTHEVAWPEGEKAESRLAEHRCDGCRPAC